MRSLILESGRASRNLVFANVGWFIVMKPMSCSVHVSDFRLDLPLISVLSFVDPDFQETTRKLLTDITAAREQPVSVIPASLLSSPDYSAPIGPSTPEPIRYAFNLILTSETVPKGPNPRTHTSKRTTPLSSAFITYSEHFTID